MITYKETGSVLGYEGKANKQDTYAPLGGSTDNKHINKKLRIVVSVMRKINWMIAWKMIEVCVGSGAFQVGWPF